MGKVFGSLHRGKEKVLKGARTVWKEDVSRCEWKQEIVLEGGE